MAEISDAQNLERNLEKLNQKLPGIATNFSHSVSEVQQLVKEVTEELQEIRESDEVKKIPEVKNSYQHLKNASNSANLYLEKVRELFQALQNKTPDLIQDIKDDDFVSLELFIGNINRRIEDCKQQYKILCDRCKEFADSCDSAERECDRLAREAETKKTVTQVAGGVTTAAVAAGGITASVLVGVFTFGIGFAVGLPIAIGATAATATAGVVTTAVLSFKYGKAAESFRKLSRRLRSLQNDISTVQQEINVIDLLTNIDEYTAIRRMTIAKIRSMTAAERNSVTETLKMTNKLAKDLSPGIDIGLNNAEAASETITRQIDNTF